MIIENNIKFCFASTEALEAGLKFFKFKIKTNSGSTIQTVYTESLDAFEKLLLKWNNDAPRNIIHSKA